MIKQLFIFITLALSSQLIFAANSEKKLPEKKEVATPPSEKETKKIAKALTLKEVSTYQESMLDSKAMSVHFKEELYRQARGVTLHKEGYAYFIKPDKFRWEVAPLKKKKNVETSKEAWIFDGTDLFQHSTKEKYATRYSAKLGKNKQLRELVDIITNFKALLSRYSFEGATQEEDLVHVKLKPKTESEIAALEIKLQSTEDKKKIKTFMKELTLHFADKNRTKFVFEPMQEETVDKTKLLIPKGVKITNALE